MTRRRRTFLWACVVAVVGTLAVLAGCGGDDDEAGGTTTQASGAQLKQSIGKGEGEVNLIAWAGYVEDGSTDPKVDWVTDFEKETGCQVNVKLGNTSDEMVTLMRTGQYDGVSASGDATLRLIAAGDVAPVNTDLIENYADVYEGLKNQKHNSVDGQMYGVPHGRGANLLMWRTDIVKPAPDSWSVVFDPNSPYKGKVTAYDSPIYIADAALYLKTHKPELGITDPYELTQPQFDAAVELLKQQRPWVGKYWSAFADEIDNFTNGTTVVGTTWPYQYNTLAASGVPVAQLVPSEGMTGWADTWMLTTKAEHPNCMLKWMAWMITPEVQAQVAEYFGEAPANPKACDLITDDPTHCDVFKAKDADFASAVNFWATPRKECLDGSGDDCVPFSEWIKAWTEIKG